MARARPLIDAARRARSPLRAPSSRSSPAAWRVRSPHCWIVVDDEHRRRWSASPSCLLSTAVSCPDRSAWSGSPPRRARSPVPVVGHGDHDDWECRQARGRPSAPPGRVQPSMPGIMTSSVIAAGRTLARQREALRPPWARRRPESPPSQEPRHQIVHDRIVVDHEHCVAYGDTDVSLRARPCPPAAPVSSSSAR